MLDSVFETFENSLSKATQKAACAHLSFYVQNKKNKLTDILPTGFRFFSDFFDQAYLICEAEKQIYFLSDAAKLEIENANFQWKNYCASISEVIIGSNRIDFLYSNTKLRLIASTALSLYEWFNDIEYIGGDKELRREWLVESPLNIII